MRLCLLAPSGYGKSTAIEILKKKYNDRKDFFFESNKFYLDNYITSNKVFSIKAFLTSSFPLNTVNHTDQFPFRLA